MLRHEVYRSIVQVLGQHFDASHLWTTMMSAVTCDQIYLGHAVLDELWILSHEVCSSIVQRMLRGAVEQQ